MFVIGNLQLDQLTTVDYGVFDNLSLLPNCEFSMPFSSHVVLTRYNIRQLKFRRTAFEGF